MTLYRIGYRAFRDWSADHGVEFEVAEQCPGAYGRQFGDAAYLRTTMLDRCRKVMAG